jgi:hypothetical protein
MSDTPEPRNKYERWIAAFTIFAKYEPNGGEVAAEHDVVYAGPNPETVNEDDIVTLDDLGWHISHDYDCFYAFT